MTITFSGTAVGFVPEYERMLPRFRVPNLVTVRFRRKTVHIPGGSLLGDVRAPAVEFSIRIRGIHNSEFGASIYNLLDYYAHQEDPFWEANAFKPAKVREYISTLQALDALYSRFKDSVDVSWYPAHIVVYDADALVDSSSETFGRYYGTENEVEQASVFLREDLRAFGVDWRIGCIEVFSGDLPPLNLAHELLHHVEQVHALARNYPGWSHEDDLRANCVAVLGADHPFLLEFDRLRAEAGGRAARTIRRAHRELRRSSEA